MTSSFSTYRHASTRRRHENRRRANPWKTQTAPQLSPAQSEEVDSDLQVARVKQPDETPDGSLSTGDILALVALLVPVTAAVSVTLYGAHHVLSQISALSTIDVLRMFSVIG